MKHNKSENPFAFFHQNEALLYQFFLHECIATCLLMKKAPSAELLNQLMGSSASKFYSLQGHLPKMLHYHELQTAHFDPRPVMISIGETLDRAFLAGQMCVDLIGQDPTECKKPYQQLKREIKKIGKLLFDLVPSYKDNSHVLYFILCRHQQLDSLYGKNAVAQLFNSLFAGGMDEMETFLSEKFTRKGFHHLIPNIQKQVKDLNHG